MRRPLSLPTPNLNDTCHNAFDEVLDEQLYHAWQSGDAAAKHRVWLAMHGSLTSLARRICAQYASDSSQADDWAADALNSAYQDAEKYIGAGHTWQGQPRFVGLLRSRVVFAARKRVERGVRWKKRAVDPPGAARFGLEEAFARLATAPALQECDDMATATTQQVVSGMIERLAMTREWCRRRPALYAVVNAMIGYVRFCCARAVTGVDTTDLSIDALIPLINRDEFEASSHEMNLFIMNTLGISRNELDCRRRRIRLTVESPSRPRCPPDPTRPRRATRFRPASPTWQQAGSDPNGEARCLAT